VINTGTAVAVIVVAVSEPASVAMTLLLELVPPNVRIGAACAPPKLAATRADVSNIRLMVVSSDGLSKRISPSTRPRPAGLSRISQIRGHSGKPLKWLDK
jgi:hypothetical protein